MDHVHQGIGGDQGGRGDDTGLLGNLTLGPESVKGRLEPIEGSGRKVFRMERTFLLLG